MPTLCVSDVPDQLAARLHVLAQVHQRSLSAQVILLLERALENEAQSLNPVQILADIRRNRFIPPSGTPDCVEMLRCSRQR